MTLATVRGLVVRFGDVVALDGVDLEVAQGEVLGLLGANGAGKTTLIRALLGLLGPSAGRVGLFGAAPTRHARLRVGYVAQTLGLYQDLTVAENWRFARAAYGTTSSLPAELEAWAELLVAELPLGAQRQAAFAQALGHDPDLLVLDEPTSGVSPLGRARLWERIRERAEAGAGVLVTTHDMEEAEQCDRLLVLVDGRVAARGTRAEIVGGRHVSQVRSEQWRRAAASLDAAGLAVQLHGRLLRVPSDASTVRECLLGAGVDASIDVVPASLEEAFVSLVARSAPAR